MTPATVVAIYGVVYFAALAAFLLIIPRLWRPEVPFGVSLPAEGTEEVRGRALRFWTMSVILLTAGAIAATLVLARIKPEMWVAQAFIVPYFALGVFLYTRVRKTLLPLAQPSTKVGASLRRRRYRDYMNPRWEGVPLGLLLVAMVALAWLFVSSGHTGVWSFERMARFGSALFPLVCVYPLLLVLAVLVAHSKQSVGTGDPAVCLAANEAFRKVWIRYFYAGRVLLTANYAVLLCCIALANKGIVKSPWLPFALVFAIGGGVVLMVAVGWIIGLRYGQGGWRWAVRKGLVGRSLAASMFNGDGMPDERWKLGMFYFNPKDPSILVETRFGVGWTVNLGNIWGISFAFAFFGMHVIPSLLRLLLR